MIDLISDSEILKPLDLRWTEALTQEGGPSLPKEKREIHDDKCENSHNLWPKNQIKNQELKYETWNFKC